MRHRIYTDDNECYAPFTQHIGVFDDHSDDLDKYSNDMPGLPINTWSNQRNRHTAWQKGMTRLVSLKVVIAADACLNEAGRAAVRALPQYADTFLRARRGVKVEVLVAECAERAERLICDGQCGKVIEEVIRGMLTAPK